jgi:hypothetical protein
MAERQITVTVPDEMFEPFRCHAEQEQQSIEEAVVSAIEAAIQPDRDQASGWRAALNALAWLDTPTLWQICSEARKPKRCYCSGHCTTSISRQFPRQEWPKSRMR